MFVTLFVLWMLFNGRFTLEVLLVGAILSFVLTLFVKKFLINEVSRSTKRSVRVFVIMVCYIFVLIVEIIKANVMVLSIILKLKLDFKPALITFKPNIKSNSLRVLLADSITLTPGTITVDLSDDGTFLVHCLDKSMANRIDNSIFVEMINKMENE